MQRFVTLKNLCNAVLLLLISGCSSPQRPVIVQPIGPVPHANERADNNGYLVVYSAWSNFVDQGSTGHHSRYTVTADSGTMRREVINHVDRFDEGPIQLPLAPGAYHVRARSSHFGRVNIPIVIQARQTTVVYLDGSAHPDKGGEQASPVTLPDGEIVGWSSTVTKNGSN